MVKEKQTREPVLSERLRRFEPETRSAVQGYRLLDDEFMRKVFEDKDCTQVLIRIILKNKDLVVKDVYCQHPIKNLQGRSVNLDIYAVDPEGNLYNIEVQRWSKGASARRARYNSSLMDADLLEAGEEYQNLRESYVIFITEKDVLKGKKTIYHIDRIISETNEPFNDGSHIIYVNAENQENTPLGRLMHDFHCTKADDMHYEVLANRVRHFKETEEGVVTMCEAVDNLVKKKTAEARAEGRAEERENVLVETVCSLMETMSISAEKAMDNLKIAEADRVVIWKRIAQ